MSWVLIGEHRNLCSYDKECDVLPSQIIIFSMYKMKAESFVGSYGKLLMQCNKYETTDPCFNVYSSDKVQPGHLGDMGDVRATSREHPRVGCSRVAADPCSHQT